MRKHFCGISNIKAGLGISLQDSIVILKLYLFWFSLSDNFSNRIQILVSFIDLT